MKRIFSFILIMLVAFVLVACGDKDDNKSTVELKTMSMFGGTDPHAETYEALLDAFEKKHKVKISDNSATSDEIWKTSVLTAFYSGVHPDVLFYFTGETALPLVTNNYVVSIDEIRAEYPDFAKNIADSVMDDYAVPLKGFVEGVFVNTELFTGDLASYLEKEIWTWEDYIAIAEKLIAKDIVPFAFGANDVPHYWIEHTVLGMVGPKAFTDISDSLENNQADWVKVLKLLNKFAELGWFGPTKGNQEHAVAEATFQNGQAAMLLDGSWIAGGYTEDTKVKASKMKVMPFPAIPKKEGGKNEVYMQSGFTSGFYISRKAWNDPKKRDLVVKLVESMTSTESVAKFCAHGGIPADPLVELADQNALQISMNSMPERTVAAILPLSDAANAGTFAELVNGAHYYLTANDAGIKAALKAFAEKQ